MLNPLKSYVFYCMTIVFEKASDFRDFQSRKTTKTTIIIGFRAIDSASQERAGFLLHKIDHCVKMIK